MTAAPSSSWCLMKVNKTTCFVYLIKMADTQHFRIWQSKYQSGYGVICAAFNCSNYCQLHDMYIIHVLLVIEQRHNKLEQWEIKIVPPLPPFITHNNEWKIVCSAFNMFGKFPLSWKSRKQKQPLIPPPPPSPTHTHNSFSLIIMNEKYI